MRTDQTRVCDLCGARFSALALALPGADPSACPACGGHGLHDLTIEAQPLALSHAGKRPATALVRKEPLATIAGFLAAFAALIASVVMIAVGHYSFALVAAVVIVVLMSNAAAIDRLRQGSPGSELYLLPPPAPTGAAARITLRGTIQCPAPIRSPLGDKPCAAFRLVGHTPAGLIDDAGATSFTLCTEAGDRYEVELGHATVDLPTGEPQSVEVGPELADFLRSRGARPLAGRAALAEAVLRDGDEVDVECVPTLEPVPAGLYREVSHRTVFRDRPDAPLVIRAAPPDE